MAAVDDIAERMKGEGCVLFLGSGVHYSPPSGSRYQYPAEQRPPLGGELAKSLAAACDFSKVFPTESPTDLKRVSQYFEKTNGRQELIKFLRKQIPTSCKPSPIVRALADLPFSMIVTTNYDDLFEQALRADSPRRAKKSPKISTYSPDETRATKTYHNATPSAPFLVKLHGDLDDPESVVITEEDYIRFVYRMAERDVTNPIPLSCRSMMSEVPIMFVGYSLLDYNLRLLFHALRAKVDPANLPRSFSIDPRPDQIIVYLYGQKHQMLTFVEEDVWAFLPRLYRTLIGEEMPA